MVVLGNRQMQLNHVEAYLESLLFYLLHVSIYCL